mmetsp:Transcript_114833/g.320914  ORF Transcript_114833/g.320914 Transcript_114833/m.320914 type:complete len:205 (+) Transcript_114833:214-828(+)
MKSNMACAWTLVLGRWRRHCAEGRLMLGAEDERPCGPRSVCRAGARPRVPLQGHLGADGTAQLQFLAAVLADVERVLVRPCPRVGCANAALHAQLVVVAMTVLWHDFKLPRPCKLKAAGPNVDPTNGVAVLAYDEGVVRRPSARQHGSVGVGVVVLASERVALDGMEHQRASRLRCGGPLRLRLGPLAVSAGIRDSARREAGEG